MSLYVSFMHVPSLCYLANRSAFVLDHVHTVGTNTKYYMTPRVIPLYNYDRVACMSSIADFQKTY